MATTHGYVNPYGGQGPLILGLSWSFAGVATPLVIARGCTASHMEGRLRWDFAWVTMAYMFALIGQIIITMSVAHGLGNHSTSQTDPRDIALASLYNWTAEIIIIIDIVFAKMAIVSFLLMIQGTTYPRLRYLLHFIWISNLLLSINQVVLILFQCKPMPKFWDDSIEGTCKLRPTISKIGFLQGAWGAASDLALAFYPMYIYWHLQMSWKLKLGLCALTGGGIIASAMATLKTIYIAVINETSDVTASFTQLILWAFIELWLIIILSSVPPLRGLFGRWYGKAATVVLHSYGNNSTRTRDEGSVQLHDFPRRGSYKVHINRLERKTGTQDDYVADNDSEEEILQHRDGIWVTRDIVLADGGPAARAQLS